MAVASLVLGIISILIAFIPFCGTFAFLPAIVGLILGIVACVKAVKAAKEEPAVAEGEAAVEPKKSHKGLSIAGIILNGLSLVIIVVWTVISSMLLVGAAGALSGELGEELQQAFQEGIEEGLAEYDDVDREEYEASLEELMGALNELQEVANTTNAQ